MPGLRQRSALQRGSHKNLAPQRKRTIMQNMGLTPNQYRRRSLIHKSSVLGKENGTGRGIRARALIAAGRKPSRAGAFKWSGVTPASEKANIKTETVQTSRGGWEYVPGKGQVYKDPEYSTRTFMDGISKIPESAKFKRAGRSSHEKVAHRGEGPVRYGTAKAVKGKSRAAKAKTQGAMPGREKKKQRKR